MITLIHIIPFQIDFKSYRSLRSFQTLSWESTKILVTLRPAVSEDSPSARKVALSSHEGLDVALDLCTLNELLASLGKFHTLQQ